MEPINIEITTPMLALVAAVALILQTLKSQVPWLLDNNMIPKAAVVLGVAVAYGASFLGMPGDASPWISGVAIGLAACSGYDLFKPPPKPK